MQANGIILFSFFICLNFLKVTLTPQA